MGGNVFGIGIPQKKTQTQNYKYKKPLHGDLVCPFYYTPKFFDHSSDSACSFYIESHQVRANLANLPMCKNW